MPTPDLNAVLRDAALVMDALYPGIRRVRIVGETIDGQDAVLPAPAGRLVRHGETIPGCAETVAPAEEDEDDDDPGSVKLDEDHWNILAVLKKSKTPLRGKPIAEHEDVDIDFGTFRKKVGDLKTLLWVEKVQTGYRITEAGKASLETKCS